MATTPTQLPVPSEKPQDLKFNSGKIDEFVTSLVNTYVDRFGNEHYTIEGLRWLAQQAIAQYGWIPFGTFQDGATLTLPNQILKDGSGEYYRWDGILPKIVPAGATPGSSGGVVVDAWLSVGDSTLKSMLASSLGAGIVGYNSGETYAPGTVGDEIGPYEAAGAENKYGRKDRARRHLSAVDFGDPETDIGGAINLAIASLETEYSPSATENIRGGTIELPRGTKTASSSIAFDAGSSGVSSLNIKGEGQSTSEIDFTGAPALTDGVAGNGYGPAYGELEGFTIKNAPRRSFSFAKYSRIRFNGVQSTGSGADGFYLGVGFIVTMNNVVANYSGSNGVRFAVELQHTSHSIQSGYSHDNAGNGWLFGWMNYSSAQGVASDNNTQNGFLLEKCSGFALNGCGAESNGRAAFNAISSSTVGETKNTTINNAFAYANNQSNTGYANLLHVTANDSVPCEITLANSVSVPSGAGSTTPDVVVNGIGAVVKMRGGNTLPNGWSTSSGGYVDYKADTLLVRNITIPVSTPTPICNLKSTQGHRVRYAGIVTILASNQQPSAGERNTTIYQLIVSKSIGGGNQVKEIGKAGSEVGGSASLPSFTWSIVSDQLVATPMSAVGGTSFWFEIDTQSQIVAYSL